MMSFFRALILAGVCLPQPGAAPSHAFAEAPPVLSVFTNALADSEGIFLPQLAKSMTDTPLPNLKLAPAPAPGQVVIFTRQQILEAAAKVSPGFTCANWLGAQRARVSRRMRTLGEKEALDLLTAALQREKAQDRGELELRFNRAWTPVSIPDEPCAARALDLPYAGITPSMVIRFELNGPHETFGSWQVSVSAKIWRDIPVAKTPLRRGQLLVPADLARERADVLTLRNLAPEELFQNSLVEMLDNVQAGMPLLARHVRAKPVIYRGQQLEALLQDGGLSITLRVEALEDGQLGQTVRVRNPQTRRELRGKVQSEQSILVIL